MVGVMTVTLTLAGPVDDFSEAEPALFGCWFDDGTGVEAWDGSLEESILLAAAEDLWLGSTVTGCEPLLTTAVSPAGRPVALFSGCSDTVTDVVVTDCFRSRSMLEGVEAIGSLTSEEGSADVADVSCVPFPLLTELAPTARSSAAGALPFFVGTSETGFEVRVLGLVVSSVVTPIVVRETCSGVSDKDGSASSLRGSSTTWPTIGGMALP